MYFQLSIVSKKKKKKMKLVKDLKKNEQFSMHEVRFEIVFCFVFFKSTLLY